MQILQSYMKDRKFDNLNWGNFDEENYSFNVDEQWSRMESRLLAGRKKRDNKFFYFFLAAGLLMFFSVAGYVYIPRMLNKQQVNKSKINNAAQTVKAVAQESTNIETENSTIIDQNKNHNTSPSNSVEQNNLSSENKPIFKNTNQATSNSHIIADNSSNLIQATTSNSVSNNSEIINLENADAETINDNNLVISPNEINIVSSNSTNQIIPINFLKLNQSLLFTKTENEISTLPKISPIIKNKTNKSSRFFGSIGLAYGLSQNTFKLIQSEKTDVVNSRNLREKSWDGIKSELMIGAMITKRLYVQTGLTTARLYTKINDDYTTSTNEILQNQIVKIVVKEGLPNDTIRGSVTITNRSRHDEKYYNKYSSISIPILIGYNKTLTKHTSLSLDGGINVSLLNQNEGYIPRSFTSPDNIAISSLKQPTKGIISLRTNASYNYHFSSKTMLSAGLGVEQDINSRINELEGYSQKFRFINLNMRLVRRF